ncbi:MAG TPA: putative ABC exporter domain-containing protein [Gemmatimonadales bacterium]|nr:putative ABC exporter domain-containing protein [Gemmatimonadales bacterium]
MIRVLGYLVFHTTRNRLYRQAIKLKNPRYALALILGFVYLWFLLVQPNLSTDRGASLSYEWVAMLGAVALAAMVAWGWAFGRDKAVLIYTPAEVHYLFPAPITRRQLVAYKLFRSQLVILLNVTLWVVLFGTGTRGLPWYARAAALWTLFSTIHLHRIGASFVRTSLARHGWAGAKRRMVSLTIIAVTLAAVAWGVLDALPDVSRAFQTDLSAVFQILGEVLHRPVTTAVLFPFRLVIDPLAAGTVAEWARAMTPAVVILLLHLIWVVRSDAAFEEASVEASLERARTIEAIQRGGPPVASRGRPPSPPIFRLAPSGWAGGAIIWKNIVAVGRTQRLRRIVLITVLFAAGFVTVLGHKRESWAGLVSGLLAGWAGVLLVFGPLWVRNDLRSDLEYADLLRAYPVGGATVVSAEAASSALVLTAAQLGLLLLALAASFGATVSGIDDARKLALFAGAVVVLPTVNLLGMLIQNGIALLFPAWVTLGPRRPSGVEALGQTMLATPPFLLALVVALAPPVVVGYAAAHFLHPALGFGAYGAGIILFLLGMGLEAFLLSEWLGGAYDRLDPSASELAGSR